MTLSTYAAKWLEYAAESRAAGTIRRYAAALKALCAELGELELARVKPDHLKTWQMRRSEAVAPTTLMVDIVVIRALFSEATEDGEIPVDPARSLKKPPLPPQAEELGVTWEGAREAVEEHAGEPQRSALLLLLSTGLRLGELLHLRWLDVADGMAHVRANGGWTPKTRSSTRRVPVGPLAERALGALREEGRNGSVCHVSARRLRKALEEALKAAGLPRLTPHKLRALFLTHLEETNIHPDIARRLAGHASLNTTMRYFRPEEETLRKAVRGL